VPGLTNGTSYTFTVRATNAIGDGAASDPSSGVVPGAVPDQVATPSAERRDGGARITWPAAGGNGYAVTAYTVRAMPGGRTVIVDGTSTAATVDGLTNGTAYTFTVTAANTLGSGAVSAPSNEVVPAGRPGQVARPTAVRGNASATVTWSAPSGNGAVVTGYTVTAAPGGRTASVAGDATTATVDGLTNGTAYTFSVVATNVAGDSTPSQPSAAVTPAAVPQRVTGVAATRGDRAATVTWDVASGNGSSVTAYAVKAAPGGRQVVVAGTTTAAVVDGLDNGTAYTFTVLATNALGDGPASTPSSAITPAGVPSTVARPGAVGGDASAVVTWSAADGNGAPVERYTVLSSPAGGACATATELTCTVTGLTNGTAYTFTVIATNDVGNSMPSAASAPVTPAPAPGQTPGTPDAPASVSAERGNRSATVRWTTADGNGSPITGYVVTTLPGGQRTMVGADAREVVVPGLANGTTYTFTVAATSAAGTSEASAPSNAVVPARRPGRVAKPSVVVKGERARLVVRWRQPAEHGSPLTRYVVRVNGRSWELAPTKHRFVLRNVVPGTYRVSVVAANEVGEAKASRATTVRVRRP
jgi:hypothetical protein